MEGLIKTEKKKKGKTHHVSSTPLLSSFFFLKPIAYKFQLLKEVKKNKEIHAMCPLRCFHYHLGLLFKFIMKEAE